MPNPSLHRTPRRPHAWAWFLLLSQVAVVAVWWRHGWQLGLAAMLASHALVLWGTMRPDSRLFSPVLRRLPVDDRRLWLTIDDGPSDDTRPMLDLLDAHAAKATFFVVGERAQARPELLREIVRRGHGLGNHSTTHPQAWFWALSPRRMREEISRAQARLRELSGVTPRWFRAVVGMANPFVAAVLRDEGLARVAWSARGFDGVRSDPSAWWRASSDSCSPARSCCCTKARRHGRNVETLALLLQRLDALGYRSVLPEELEAEPCRSGRRGSDVSRDRAHELVATYVAPTGLAGSRLRRHDPPVVERRPVHTAA